ncbi:hypothetical protein [Brunnivagina elsteri]|uniref:Uncharacterized protein n=1 Tax=Brunnivagina elsteri CCALA 953 TaxID=987040 RepID=A0A2A2TAW3_9CYAN|nr:hypothetical protein [Calothrix elsteri]PAX48943.1 hypothetical protein CK510_28145 [Calothrix elsteri CCALA 953]
MNNPFGFIVKVFFFSALISVLIKYVSPIISIPQSDINVLILVLSPTAIMAVLLSLRFRGIENRE